jgi:hypothetical protein
VPVSCNLFCNLRPRKTTILALSLAFSALALSRPASASNVTIASPVNGTLITSPAWIRAHNVGCDSLAPTAFGYSIDNSPAIVVGVTPYDIDVTGQSLAAGTHTVYFKSWTTNGICPVDSTTFTVTDSSGTAPASDAAPSSVPSYAVSSGDLDGRSNWIGVHDGGTPGESRGSTVYPATTPSYDDARKFYMTYSGRAGERWSDNFGKDAKSTYFVFDTYVYFTDASQVENLELDLNQVISDGKTVILGTQCSSVTGTWEAAYTSGPHDHWKSTNVKCNPRTWGSNQWHHIQIAMHRDNNGVVTHDWVNVDNVHDVFTTPGIESAHSLGWAEGDMIVNYQIEGENAGSGSVTSFIHKMTIFRWTPQ